MASEIGVTGRSTLLDQDFHFAGFCFLKHPTDNRGFVQVSVYRGRRKWVICLSEGRGKGSTKAAKLGLGGIVPGRLVAPFAQRQLKDGDKPMPFETLKQVLESSYNRSAMYSDWQWANSVFEVSYD